MTADLGLVAHAAEGDAYEVATQGTRDRLPQRGLADAGRTDEREHRARAPPADHFETALRATGANGEVFDDAVLHVVQAVVVGVEHGSGSRDVGAVDGALVPRQVEHGVQPGADPTGLRALVARPFELADLAQGGLAHLVRQRRSLDAGAVVVGTVRVVLTEFLAYRRQLLAQQELALALVHALAHVVADLLADLQLGEVLAGPADDQIQALLDVGRLEQFALVLGGQVRRVAGQVGEFGRVGDPLHRVDHLPRVAALQDGDDQPLVLGGEFAGAGRRLGFVDRRGLDPQRRTRPADTGSDPGPGAGAQHRRGFTVGQSADLLDLGDRAVDGVTVGKSWRDEQRAVGPGAGRVDHRPGGVVQLDGHDHARQDDLVGQRQHRKVDRGK